MVCGNRNVVAKPVASVCGERVMLGAEKWSAVIRLIRDGSPMVLSMESVKVRATLRHWFGTEWIAPEGAVAAAGADPRRHRHRHQGIRDPTWRRLRPMKTGV